VQGDPADLSLAIEGAAQPVRVFDLRLTP
jgi:hypothetical protein